MPVLYAEDLTKIQPEGEPEPSFPVTLPIRYRDAESMTAFFPLPTRHVRGLLPSPQMKPVEVVPGYSVVAFVAFEYPDTDIGPYNELGMCFPILFKNPLSLPFLPMLFEKRYPRLGFYVHHLPVTTDVANRAGREFYGYPKFVADIHFEENGEQRICHLHEGGKHVLSLAVDRPEGRLREEERNLVTYSILGDEVLKTVIETRMQIEHRRIRGASLTLGEHSISRELRRLEISDRILESRFAGELEAVLPAPSPC
jgi:Acetoacetate decarboxylase (ADC)